MSTIKTKALADAIRKDLTQTGRKPHPNVGGAMGKPPPGPTFAKRRRTGCAGRK